MDRGIEVTKENPQRSANFLSKLTFAWMIKLFKDGTVKGLSTKDLYIHNKADDSERLGDLLEKQWNDQLAKVKLGKLKAPSLTNALFGAFFWTYMIYGIMMFVLFVGLKSFQPVVLAYLVSLFTSSSSEDQSTEMYISGSILVGISLISVFMTHHMNAGLMSVGMRLRISTSSMIYRKILRLSKKSLGETAAGQIVNLLSNDVNRFDMVTVALHFLWIMPFQVALVTYLIWLQVGIATLSGVVSMALFTLPVQGYLGKLTSTYRMKTAKRTDLRVRLMNEIISGIQVIKMYAWEKPFEKVVEIARKHEIDVVTKASYLRGVYLSCAVFIERTTLYLTVITYALMGNHITAGKVSSMMQFFNLLQLAMALYYPMAISMGAETLISIKRLQNFLMMEEKKASSITKTNDRQITVKDVNASWTSEMPLLQDFSLNVKAGQLCAIVGPVGAGKSSVLQLLLGELPKQSGDIQIGGNISYSSQEPWLFVSTVRNNILFGLEHDKQKYSKMVKVCALETDFDQFPQRDKTMVGERGVSLSGGQRARINLARSVYRDADIYLLDDPLSAVDTHVGKHLFEECILKYLSGKTRILITHQLQYLKKADHIVVINEGKIEAQGTFAELSHSKLDFTKMLIAADETVTEEVQKTIERRDSVLSQASIQSSIAEEIQKNEEEFESTGQSAFMTYIKAAGNWCTILTLISVLLLGQAFCTGADLWVTLWTQDEEIRMMTNSTSNETTTDPVIVSYETHISNYTGDLRDTQYTLTYIDPRETIVVDNNTYTILDTYTTIYIYSGFIAGVIFVTLIRSFLFFKIAMIASKNLHNRMFSALLKAPMRFFDTNPSGRVLNRFSKDIGCVDEFLPRVLLESIQILLVMLGILVTVSYSNQWMIIVMAILAVVFLKLRSLYIITAKNIKHIEGVAKSPVFSCVSSTLDGISTIRACNAEEVLRKEFDNHQNSHTSAWYLTIICMTSFGLWLDIVAVIFVACVTYSFIVLHGFSVVSGSLVGLAISQSLILTGMLQYGVRQTGEVVNQLTSVERVMQYTKLDKEWPFETPSEKQLMKEWPNRGHVKFSNVYLRYSPNDPPVLKNLNFEIQPAEKVGIVGRTGAGKSSLISALFRLTTIEGQIVIDGVNTLEIGLTDLRKKISIIPQEPVLFSATLRYNLDPFNEYDDKKLWSALEEVELKEAVPALDYQVSEGGSNFSLGQRQLVCLARAIVRENKILVLDEATANVDPRTDNLIQATIRRKFAKCTVLTIAHRLNTIMDSDKVIVMDGGSVLEFNHPHTLLSNPEGQFTKMVEQTGPSMTQQLRTVAEEAYKRKFGDMQVTSL